MRISVAVGALGLMTLFDGGCGTGTNKLIAQLTDSDLNVRRAAARALCDEPKRAAEPTIAALAQAAKDSDREVRVLSLAALGRIGPAAKSVEPAIEELLVEREQSTRTGAALALARIDPQNERYRHVILESLSAGDGPVFLVVGRMGADAQWAVPTLTTLLVRPAKGIRALAAQTLGQIGPAASEAQSALTQSLRDSDPAVRGAAQRALDQIRQQRPGT